MKFITKNEVMEAATELGEALKASKECRAAEQAFEILSLDEEAVRILNEAPIGDLSAPEQLDPKLRSNPVIMNHLETQNRLDMLIGQVNDEISKILGIDFTERPPKKSSCR